jgi:hypothetical protein
MARLVGRRNASAPGLGNHLLSYSRAQTRAPPAGGVPPGPVYEVWDRLMAPTDPHASTWSALSYATRKGPASGLVGSASSTDPVCSTLRRLGRSPAPPGLPPREVPRWRRLPRLASSGFDPFFGLVTRPGPPPGAAAGWPTA